MHERIFITGALGLIGGKLSDHYRAEGAELRGVDVRAADGVVAGDVAAAGEWQRHAEGCDLVVHTAAIVSLRPQWDGFWEINVRGVRNALDAAVRAGAKRFVHFSSVTVFGFDYPDGADETYPVRPTGVPYIDTKIASEAVALAAHGAGEIEVTVIRPGDVWGPGATWTVLPMEAIKGKRVVLPARGRGQIVPAYIDNLVDGVTLAAAAEAGAGQIFTIADGYAVDTADIFGRYAEMLGVRRPPRAPTALAKTGARIGGLVLRDSELSAAAVEYVARRGNYSIDKARRLLGYEPKIGYEEGLRRIAASL